jgi:hypothetical protein
MLDLAWVREMCQPYGLKFQSIWLLWQVWIAQMFPSNAFGHACHAWCEIPGYRQESEKQMGIPQ